jgi:hypothetical protein
MRKARRASFNEPSLVPMADMLSNTVGIMVFILVFTVLTAAGAMVTKHLPMEHDPGDRVAVFFICLGEQVLPLGTLDDVIDSLFDDHKPPSGGGYSEWQSWTSWFDKRELDLPCFTVKGSAGVESFYVRASFACVAKPGTGEDPDQLQKEKSWYRSVLERYHPDNKFVYFEVYPDGLKAFQAARTVAHTMHFDVGWDPIEAGRDLRVNLGGGGGRTPKPQ